MAEIPENRIYRVINSKGEPELLEMASFFGTESEDVRFFESANPPESYGEVLGRFVCIGRADLKITFVIATHSRTLLAITNTDLESEVRL